MKFLLVQTAFIGDAILASALLEKLYHHYPESEIDFIVRKGNDSLFNSHPFIHNLIVWDKKGGKYKNLFTILKSVRKQKYDYLINLQRFATTGLFAGFSKAKHKIGFKKNPFSFLFTKKLEHDIGNGKHEVERNHKLIEHLTTKEAGKPVLYPSKENFDKVKAYKTGDYICVSPASVWFTKQFPKEKWIEFMDMLSEDLHVYLLGGSADAELCEFIKSQSWHKKITQLAGKLNLLESAALMKDAKMNYTNDSAPLHIASAMDAPITAVFCSTVAEFGFGPLSENSKIIQTKEKLNCRPCGLHGKKECPEDHFKCAHSIDIKELALTSI